MNIGIPGIPDVAAPAEREVGGILEGSMFIFDLSFAGWSNIVSEHSLSCSLVAQNYGIETSIESWRRREVERWQKFSLDIL